MMHKLNFAYNARCCITNKVPSTIMFDWKSACHIDLDTSQIITALKSSHEKAISGEIILPIGMGYHPHLRQTLIKILGIS